MSGAGSTPGHGPRSGLRLRGLTETPVPEQPPGRLDTVGRHTRRLALAAWATVRPNRNRTTGYVAVGAVAALVGTSVAVGVGAAGSLPRLADIGAWLGSSQKGEAAHADGLTGDVDGKVSLPGMDGHPVQISQDGKSVLVLDSRTGKVIRIDPAQLTAEQSTDYGAAGLQLVSGGAVSYIVDAAHGTVQQIDPVRTTPVGPKIDIGAPLGTPAVDPQGTLWVPVPGRGQVVPVVGGAKSPAVDVGKPGDNLVLTLADGEPVVTDTSAGVLDVLSATGTQGSFDLAGLAGAGPSAVQIPAQTDSTKVPVLDTADGTLDLIDIGTGRPTDLKVPIEHHRLGAPQTLGTYVYIPDDTTGYLLKYAVDSASWQSAVRVTGRPGTLNIFVRDNLLWANDENNATAAVVNSSGITHAIGKYADDVPTQRRPQEHNPVVDTVPNAPRHTGVPDGPSRSHAPAGPPPGPLPTHSTPPSPKPSRNCGLDWRAGCPEPMAPGTPQVQPGAGTITVTFAAASGTTPENYTLGGAPSGATVTPDSVGPDGPFTFQVSGGSCDQDYTFTVVAHYAGGAPDKTSQPSAPARPCLAPTTPQVRVTVPQGGHGATLSWNAVGSGTTYAVAGAGAAATTTGTSHRITGLQNSQSYTATVTARNAAGSAVGSAAIDLTPPSASIKINDNNSQNTNKVDIHSGPNVNDGITDTIPGLSHPAVTVLCKESGGSASQDGETSDIWDHVVHDGKTGWLSDVFLEARTMPSVWDCQ